jgi:hypothetical protein
MLHEIGREIETAIRAKGCPFPVIDGPEPTNTTTFARERIVIEYTNDSFAAPMTQHVRVRHVMRRMIGAKISIYAQSGKPSAQPFEHRRRAEHVLDQVLVALTDVVRARMNNCEISSGGFVQPGDLEGSDNQGGALYVLEFTIDRSVFEQRFTGEVAPTVVLTGKAKTVSEIRGPQGDAVPPETACGGD